MRCSHDHARRALRTWCRVCGAHRKSLSGGWRLPRAAERWRTGKPESSRPVLVTTRDGDIEKAIWCPQFEGGTWRPMFGVGSLDVIAWMPLPRAFKPARRK